ncbi:hypothetical protein BHE74_00026500, partial [Ensete ventricosum]
KETGIRSRRLVSFLTQYWHNERNDKGRSVSVDCTITQKLGRGGPTLARWNAVLDEMVIHCIFLLEVVFRGVLEESL